MQLLLILLNAVVTKKCQKNTLDKSLSVGLEMKITIKLLAEIKCVWPTKMGLLAHN
jgi:hypothetical protein